MNAPDKIYIANNVFPTHIDWDGSPINTKRIESRDIEYIRKDALLEVIENARKAAVIQKNFNNCPAEQEVRIDVYDYIMNKIESL